MHEVECEVTCGWMQVFIYNGVFPKLNFVENIFFTQIYGTIEYY